MLGHQSRLGSADASQHGFSLRVNKHSSSSPAFNLHGPCAWLSQEVTLVYRGVPVRIGSPTGTSHSADCNVRLSDLAADLIHEGCVAPLAIDSRLPLLDLALLAVPTSALAPTPACNLDDHFQLLNAVLHSASSVPESAAHAIEVGSFAGHTLLLQAAALQMLGLNRSQVHSVEVESMYGMPDAMMHATQRGLNARWHHSLVDEMPEWERPLRLFFEDSHHDPTTTNQSFTHFESRVVEGGLVVMHDVGCCASEYGANTMYLSRRVFRKNHTYRELGAQTPSWDWLNATNQTAFGTLRSSLIQSADKRKQFRDYILESERRRPMECPELCHHSQANRFYKKLRNGYAWSTCRNTRVFERKVKQAVPFIIRMTQTSREELRGNGSHEVELDACKIIQLSK